MTTNTKSECETKLCNYSATRTRFYNGMLLTDEHLRAEQYYFREALRRLTRHLFGWGVVCGLEIVDVKGFCLKVTPGVAIDCCGNLIEVCKCITLNLSQECAQRYGSDCIPQTPQEPFAKYLVLRYLEDETDPEPVLTPPDDCALSDGKPQCQASKIREGYCLELWDHCPCAEKKTTRQDRGLEALLLEASEERQQANKVRGPSILPLPDCSPCGCCENAVGLGLINIDCEHNEVVYDPQQCRRRVVTPRFLDSVWARVYNAATRGLEELHPSLAYPATANLVGAAVEYERSRAHFKQLEGHIAQLRKEVTRLDRVIKKQANTQSSK